MVSRRRAGGAHFVVGCRSAALRWASGPCRGKGAGEQALFRTLMPHLPEGGIIPVDRHHCTCFTVAMLAERKVDILTRQHQRRLTDFRGGKCLENRDRLAAWDRPQRPRRMDAGIYGRMPEQLALRQAGVAGRILVTTLAGAYGVTPLDLGALYQKCWQAEVGPRPIKDAVGMDILRAKSPATIGKEIAVHLLAYNPVRGLVALAVKWLPGCPASRVHCNCCWPSSSNCAGAEENRHP